MQTLASFLPYLQVGISGLVIVLILLQKSEAGLGGAFGGDGGSSFHTKRGGERVLFYATIIAAVLFAATALAALVLRS